MDEDQKSGSDVNDGLSFLFFLFSLSPFSRLVDFIDVDLWMKPIVF